MREKGLEYAWKVAEKMKQRRQKSPDGPNHGGGRHTQSSRSHFVKSTLSLPPAFGAPGFNLEFSPYSAPVVPSSARAASPTGQRAASPLSQRAGSPSRQRTGSPSRQRAASPPRLRATSPPQFPLSPVTSRAGGRKAHTESPRGMRDLLSDGLEVLESRASDQAEWCSRHHITWSLGNAALPPNKRVYFDALPQVGVRAGRYTDVGVPWPDSGSDTNRHQQQRRWQWYNYPQYQSALSSRSHYDAMGDVGSRGTKNRAATAAAELARDSVAQQRGLGEGQRTIASARTSSQEQLSFPELPPASSRDGAVASTRSSQEKRASQVMESFVCEQCGNRFMPDSKFCRKCGNRRSELTEMPAMLPRQASMAQGRVTPTGGDALTPKAKKSSRVQKKKEMFTQTKMAELEHASALKNFMSWIESTHSTVVKIWRILDKDGNMRLSKQEFTRGLHALHYRGDYNALWTILDRDHSGWVSFIHFAAEPAIILAHFKKWLDDGYGSAKSAFRAFDKSRDGKLTFPEFAQAIQREGFEENFNINARTLFDLIDDSDPGESKGARTISLQELLFLDAWECPEYLWVDPDEAAAEEFRRILAVRYRQNLLLAWRRILDKDSSMRVCYHEFQNTCKQLSRSEALAALVQNPSALFRAFDTNASGWLSLREFDMPAYTLLTTYCEWVKKEFGRPSQSIKALASDKQSLNWNEFRKAVHDGIGLSKDEAEYLFEGLSMEKKSGTIIPQELVFLDKWDYKAELEEELAWDEMVQMQKRQIVVEPVEEGE